jgi:hypothetical protein
MFDLEKMRTRHKRLNEEIARLQKEADEIGIAIRVFDRFNDKPPDKGKSGSNSGLPPRPKGTPTTFNMVEMILMGAAKEGKDTITSRELMDEIRAKYWPGVKNSQILPSIFGYAKTGRLKREGMAWKTIRK